jgi:N-acylneuraminate cytidylyltransferase
VKAIIPAKDNSIRIPHKNFINFYNDKSLVDLTIEKLLNILNPEDIYLSCENEEKRSISSRWGINFLKRDKSLTSNDTPLKVWLNKIVDQVPGDEDIAWCQVIDPIFNEYNECITRWQEVKDDHDSLVVVYPKKHYFLDSNYNPYGFGFGDWHVKSQNLPKIFQFTFTLSILKRSCVKNIGYHIGVNPYWYHSESPTVDIDTPEDFKLAQIIYSSLNK